jgi:acyl carrier protein
MADGRKEIIEKLLEKVSGSYDVDGELEEHTNVATVIDSLDTMNYIFYLEEEYGIKLSDEQVANENVLVIGKTADMIIASQG